jgi:hypothetical protein
MDRSTRSRNGAIGPVLTHAASTVEAGQAAGAVHMAGGEHIRVWRLRAAELRVLAGTLEDASARLGVLHAARNYDAMAAEAEAGLMLDPVYRGTATLLPA